MIRQYTWTDLPFTSTKYAERHDMKQIVVIKHRSTGEGRYEKCPAIKRRIIAHHMEGTVEDHCHEVWRVRKGDDLLYYTTG